MPPADDLSQTLRAILSAHVTDDVDAIGQTHTCSAAHVMVAAIGGDTLADVAMGWRQVTPTITPLPVEAPAVFDIASVTKAMVPATLAMIAVDRELASLNTPVSQILPMWEETHDTPTILLHLLNHTSGLPAWYKYYKEVPFDVHGEELRAQRAQILARVLKTPRAPAGTVYAYSDLGYMALMLVCEQLFGNDLATVAQREIFDPLGLARTQYVSRLHGDAPIDDAVATEWCDHRGRVVVGEVHDENTYVLGGVSGHAGVFSTAPQVLRFVQHLASIDAGVPVEAPPLVTQETVRAFWSRDRLIAGGHHVAGWDTPSGEKTSAGRGFSREATVGHLGFTGTSVWLDRQAGVIAVLLTNRVHPSRENPRMLRMRMDVHEAILAP